jgi:isochorismate hydrolase
MSRQKPQLPKPETITVDASRTAVLVLDGSQRWGDPAQPCNRLIPAIPKFLDRARKAALPIVYTVSFRNKGTPEGQVYTGLNRRPNEPVIYPNYSRI